MGLATACADSNICWQLAAATAFLMAFLMVTGADQLLGLEAGLLIYSHDLL